MKLNSILQIGFVHKDDLNLITKEVSKGQFQIDFQQYGICVRTDGVVTANGANLVGFDWRVEYGDTIGIGMTKHEGYARVWVTRNGILQNPPTQEQTIKYIDVGSKGTQAITTKKAKAQSTQQQAQKKRKEEALEIKRKIQVKLARKFSFYAVIVSESPTNPKRDTVINWNLGGQNFRLFDANGLGGLLG